MADGDGLFMTARSARSIDAAWLLAGTALATVVLVASNSLAANSGDALVRNTIRLSLAWYAASLFLMLRLVPGDWIAESFVGRVTRWCWTWACLVYLIHVALAFHHVHHWSHMHALQHVRDESGVGEGIYVSYFFTAVWTADVLFWWLTPTRYASRSRWVDRLLHGFMLFIVFNGTVVYEDGPIRWVSAAIFAFLATAWWRSRVRREQKVSSGTASTTTPGKPRAI